MFLVATNEGDLLREDRFSHGREDLFFDAWIRKANFSGVRCCCKVPQHCFNHQSQRWFSNQLQSGTIMVHHVDLPEAYDHMTAELQRFALKPTRASICRGQEVLVQIKKSVLRSPQDTSFNMFEIENR